MVCSQFIGCAPSILGICEIENISVYLLFGSARLQWEIPSNFVLSLFSNCENVLETFPSIDIQQCSDLANFLRKQLPEFIWLIFRICPIAQIFRCIQIQSRQCEQIWVHQVFGRHGIRDITVSVDCGMVQGLVHTKIIQHTHGYACA